MMNTCELARLVVTVVFFAGSAYLMGVSVLFGAAVGLLVAFLARQMRIDDEPDTDVVGWSELEPWMRTLFQKERGR